MVVPWELFRPKLHAALAAQDLRTPAAKRKSAAGRKPWDEVLIFKALVVQALYNLADEQAEYQLRDRLSFMRFLGLGLEDPVLDATTLWLYREALALAGAVEELFAAFDGYLREHGLLAMGGQIVDATIVAARASVTAATSTRRSSAGRRRQAGSRIPPRQAKKMLMRAGPKSTAVPTTARRTTAA